MKTMLSRLLVAFALALFALAPVPVAAQATNLPPRTHPHATRMSIKAHEMQKRVADEIATAKSKGQSVALAEKHKSEGDTALDAGHLRIAVEHYEAAQKALGK